MLIFEVVTLDGEENIRFSEIEVMVDDLYEDIDLESEALVREIENFSPFGEWTFHRRLPGQIEIKFLPESSGQWPIPTWSDQWNPTGCKMEECVGEITCKRQIYIGLPTKWRIPTWCIQHHNEFETKSHTSFLVPNSCSESVKVLKTLMNRPKLHRDILS